jgi:hypothetical protein
MIAVCPTCHDSIHNGDLRTSDDDLYRWKGIQRDRTERTAHIYVEPAPRLKLLTGTIALSTTIESVAVFKLSNSNRLTLRIFDGDILQISARLQNLAGKEVLRVVQNHVRAATDRDVHFEFRPGRARVSIPATEAYIEQWVVAQMRAFDPSYAVTGQVTAFDCEVLEPGLVRVEGFWPADEGAIIITRDALNFCRRHLARPVSLVGEGKNSVLLFAGEINASMFRLG